MSNPDQTANPMTVSPQQLQEELAGSNPPVLVDCREPQEQAIAMLNAAQSFPLSRLAEQQDELIALAQQSVVVYCHHGIRSLQLAQWLSEKGFRDVRSLEGGLDRWAEQLDPAMPRY